MGSFFRSPIPRSRSTPASTSRAGVGGQGNPDGVSNSLEQQCADTGRRFYQSHPFGARLRDPHMQGIGAGLRRQLVGTHHGGHVGGFDGQDNIVEIEFFQQGRVIQRAVPHGLGRGMAVLCQYLLLQGSGVHPDTDGNPPLPAGIGHRLDPALVPDVAPG